MPITISAHATSLPLGLGGNAFMRAAILAAPPSDPAITAIAAYRCALNAYESACQRWEEDDDHPEIHATGRAECLAAVAALTTAPTTLPGLRAFCEFGAFGVKNGGLRLAEWSPANNAFLRSTDKRDAETMYFDTLAEAVRHLLPA